MAIYARIDSGVVAELFETDGDIGSMFNPSLVWVDVSNIVPEPQPQWVAESADGVWTFSPPPPPPANPSEIRAQRDSLLAQSDWLMRRHQDQVAASSSTSLSAAKFAAWLTYRQGLRDVPAQPGFPSTVTWPVAPV